MGTSFWFRGGGPLLILALLAACGDDGEASGSGYSGSYAGSVGQGGAGSASGASGNSGAGANTSPGGSSGTTPAVPASLTIEVVSALIGPSKVDHTEWDGPGKIPDSVVTGLAAALGAGQFAPVLSYMATEAAKAVSKPDPFGFMEVNAEGQWVSYQGLVTVDDTFTPQWPGPPGWTGVPYSKSLRIRVNLSDEDVAYDDPIGVAEINGSDIAAAWAAQKVYQVRVAEQTSNQILYIGISVTESK
jgi:hypothetical protein